MTTTVANRTVCTRSIRLLNFADLLQQVRVCAAQCVFRKRVLHNARIRDKNPKRGVEKISTAKTTRPYYDIYI